MSEMNKVQHGRPAWLLLQDGTILAGENFGAAGTVTGEVVFSTAMTGYQEALTDPCYYGQIYLQTFPMMGNYGVNHEDFSGSHCFLRGCIVREWCDAPSNFRCEGDIDTFLREQNVVGLWGIDTRHLTRILREKGTMTGTITTDEAAIPALQQALSGWKLENAVAAVTESQPATIEGNGPHIGIMNLGAPSFAASELQRRGCKVSFHSVSDGIEAYAGCDGVVLSEGPGDPAEEAAVLDTIRALAAAGKPLFGIGLGHQLLALSQGASVCRLHHGHRGASQPVIDNRTKKTYPTSQNHGYEVVDLPAEAGEISHQNVNDGSCEGIRYSHIKALSVQFRPVGPGEAQDTGYLYDEFLAMVR